MTLANLVTARFSYAQSPHLEVKKAQKLITEEEFETAIKVLRKHLRRDRRNYSAWTLLGVAYYHTGLPKRGLKILRFAENRASNRAYNHYYQALCYDALGREPLAIRYFQKVATSKSEYADPATFELSILFYRKKRAFRAKYWNDYYLSRFPSGRFKNQSLRLRQYLQSRRFGRKINGIRKPNLERALFRYNPLSLSDTPHYWFLNLGGAVVNETGFEPNNVLESKSRTDQITQINFSTGGGIGPLKQNNASLYTGYTYSQNWYSTQERLDTYLNDPADIAYFPYRPDLLQRSHKVYGDVRFALGSKFYLGVYGSFDHVRLGSSIPGPEIQGIEENVATNNITLFIPWTGINWSSSNRSLFYWYFYKDINFDEPGLSYQSYSFTIESFPVSIGFNHTVDIKSMDSSLSFELYRYELIYNDPLKDHARLGFLASLSHQLLPTINLELAGGYYQDTYIEKTKKLEKCSLIEKTLNEGEAGSAQADFRNVVECERIDTGFLISAQVSWNYRQFYSLFAKFQYLSNTNDDLKQNDFEQQSFIGGISLAFPSVKRTRRYTERFSDKGLEKGLRP